MKRFAPVLLALAVVAAGAGVATAPAATGCPSPVSCRLYRLSPERWPAKNGVTAIRYRINASQPWLMSQRVIDAIGAAAATWQRANPRVRLVFERTTTDPPQLGDGVNEIAWAATLDSTAVAQTNHRVKGRTRLEADTLLNAALLWGWTPCEQRNNACTDTSIAPIGLKTIDLQAVMTHEFGHWLGLESLAGSAASELTMFETVRYGERKQDTLGLGEVLAVRAAYPCRGCRMPAVFAP